jgi:hypothetical protein
MIRALTLLSALSVFSMNAEAISSSTVGSFACSESLSISISDTASFSCIGNFSLSGGGITSESKIVITSSGSLALDNLSIVAPFVELNSQSGQLSIGNGVLINTSSFLATAGVGVAPSLSLSPGASISVGSGESARIIGSSEILGSIKHGAITPLVGGDISIIPSVPEPSTYILMVLGLVVIFGLPKGVNGKRYA